MILKRFRVTNFRSVIDSGWINCDDVTTLVGINESGKSNILLALWKLNPAKGGNIDPLHDLPVTLLSELRNELDETSFIEAVFELGDSVDDINEQLDADFSSGSELLLGRRYNSLWHYSFVGEKDQEKLDALQQPRKAVAENGEEKELSHSYEQIFKVIHPYVPQFVYYSNYGNLTSRIYLPHAIQWLKGQNVPGVDIKEEQVRTIRVLFDYVNLMPEEIYETGKNAQELAHCDNPPEETIKKVEENKEKRALLLQSAGTKLTTEFREWWKQGEYQFRFSADGDYFYIWVSDDKRHEEVDLSQRSTGLQWFLSFYLIFLMECKKENKDSILLLDEAGLTLHPLAQRDLAAFFNMLAQRNQIINTTHSPFIVDPEKIDRCRVVYTDDNGATVVSEDLRAGTGEIGRKSIYAVHAALGLTVSDVMLQGCQVVLVEGPSDQFYLSAIKTELVKTKKLAPKKEIVFAPVGGVKAVSSIAGILSSTSNDLPMVILDSDKNGDDYKKKLEKELYSDCAGRILSIKDYTEIELSEIEDLIPYSFIQRSVERLLSTQEEDCDFVPKEGEPLLPQIESYAQSKSIELKQGWKVGIARFFGKMLERKQPDEIPEHYLKMWISLFKKINS